eukprot:gnl/TRDRNA2_/TRDRNA2_143438_c0_seq1.p1 gnl/TRDRNA2_/TRDRNA2_143438_c0~~gnl/TRDRNA2_/TRDRNA2_143438_c0_seq1.p1  ORF type:complete len:185 (+),score=19.21 gnl/TRDRNA2_/TRDRNA2_143438_c0_seq1:2-556(+)
MVIGEIGIPMDMRVPYGETPKEAYAFGDFSGHLISINHSMRALEAWMVSSTWWNYTQDNNNERGDNWNKEDLSIWSADQQKDPDDLHSGGRGLQTLVRPYAYRIAGVPLEMRFDPFGAAREFFFSFRSQPNVSGPTVLFVPQYQYPDGVAIEVSDGSHELCWEKQTLLYTAGEADEHWIRLSVK